MLSRYLKLGVAAVTVGAAFTIVIEEKQRTDAQKLASQQQHLKYRTLTINHVGVKA